MSQRTTESFKIGEFTYEMSLFDPDTADAIVIRLLKVAGPAMQALSGGELESADLDLGKAFSLAAKNLSEEDLAFVSRKLYGKTVVRPDDGKPFKLGDTYQAHFMGRYKSRVEFLIKGLKAQFAEFFTDGGVDFGL